MPSDLKKKESFFDNAYKAFQTPTQQRSLQITAWTSSICCMGYFGVVGKIRNSIYVFAGSGLTAYLSSTVYLDIKARRDKVRQYQMGKLLEYKSIYEGTDEWPYNEENGPI